MCKNKQSLSYTNKIYQIGDTTVYNGTYGSAPVIIKIITNSPIYGIRHKTLREISSLKKFNSDNIIKLLEIKYIVNQNENVTILIYEKYGVSLNKLNVCTLNKKSILKDITNGLKYIHKLGFIHGDLNISNVVINNSGETCKIIDFGNCTRVYRLSAISMPMLCITPIEMLNSLTLTNLIGIDSWALGCMAYYITTGSHLFFENNYENLKHEVKAKFSGVEFQSVKKEMLKYVDNNNFVKHTSKLFNNNPHKRYSVDQFYDNLYNSNYDDKLNEIKEKNTEDFQKVINNKDRNFMMNMLISINTENLLPIENIFITFKIMDTIEPKFNYKIDTMIIYTIATKLVCNSHFPLTCILDMIKKIDDKITDVFDLDNKIKIILEYHNWNFDVETLMVYLPEINENLKKKYIIISTFVTYLSKYKSISDYYKKELIFEIFKKIGLNLTKTKCSKDVNNMKNVGKIKHIIKLIKENINNNVLIKYFKAVNIFDEYKCLKLQMFNYYVT